MTAWFLNHDERSMAVERVRENKTGIKNDKWKTGQIVEALTDPKAWLLVLIQMCCNIPNGGITSVSYILLSIFRHSWLTVL